MFPTLNTILLIGEWIGVLFVPVVLIRKKHPVSAWAWCLTVIFIPYLGVLLFLVFGASRVRRRLRRKLIHRSRFLRQWTGSRHDSVNAVSTPTWGGMDQYTIRVGAAPASDGNDIRLYSDGCRAFEEKFEAIRNARHHVHLEYFILRNDSTGRALIDLLLKKTAEGVQVRLLVDGVGSREARPFVKELRQAGAKAMSFLLPRLFSSRFTLGLRNHRKILVCDGKIGFMGGLNVGDEYMGKDPSFGYWRDTHVKVTGPAVLSLQRVFVEDWDFASGELLVGDDYFPEPLLNGDARLQIVWSGPDQENNATRETFFAAITAARKRLWIATPYLVPDGALLAALRSTALRKADVRILTQSYPPDHWITYWAGRYFWEELLSCGARIYEYQKGMMHAKVAIADSSWACVGSANLDIRSIRLNFEVNCHIHTPNVIAELESVFEEDLNHATEIKLHDFRRRPWRMQLAENVCRLFSPLL